MSTNNSVRASVVNLIDTTIFFALLALIISTAIPHGTIYPIWVAIFECVVFALGALWSIEGLLGGKWLMNVNRLFMPLLALTLFAFFQIVPMWNAAGGKVIEVGILQTISADPYETRLFVFKLFALILVGVLLLRYTSSRQRLHWLIHVVIAVGLVSALFGLLRYATQQDDWWVRVHVPHLWSVYVLYSVPDLGFGQFINRNHFALLMEMTLGLLLGLVVGGAAVGKHLLLYLVAAVPVWTALVLTTSRGAVFSMIGQLLFIAVLFASVRLPQKVLKQSSGRRVFDWQRLGNSLAARAVLIGCLLVVVILGVMWVGGGDSLVSRLNTVPGEFSTDEVRGNDGTRRIEIWRATWQLIKANPLFGVGFGAYSTVIPQYHDASGKWMPEQAHNDYLELVASGGIIGVGLAIWFVVAFIGQARKRLRTTDSFRRATCFGALTGLFGVALHSLVDFGIHITINALVCVVLIVIATVNVQLEKQRSARRQNALSLSVNL